MWTAAVDTVTREISKNTDLLYRSRAELQAEFDKREKALAYHKYQREETEKQLEQAKNELNHKIFLECEKLAKQKEAIHQKLLETMAHHQNMKKKFGF